MKKATRIFTIAALMLLMLGFNRCKDDNDDGVPDILATKMSAKIDNVEWKSVFRQTTLVHMESFDVITILGTSGVTEATGSSILITIRGSEAKTYDLKSTVIGGAFQCEVIYKESFSVSLDDAYVGSSGTVNLTKVDTENKKISGTFSFTMRKSNDLTQTKTISEGKFDNITYVVASSR